jgi:hypothetical protein
MTTSTLLAHERAVIQLHAEFSIALLELDAAARAYDAAKFRYETALGKLNALARSEVVL